MNADFRIIQIIQKIKPTLIHKPPGWRKIKDDLAFYSMLLKLWKLLQWISELINNVILCVLLFGNGFSESVMNSSFFFHKFFSFLLKTIFCDLLLIPILFFFILLLFLDYDIGPLAY